MALQGTIDSFSLSDVMRLLNTSSKTGRLIVNGDRGSASLWISGGQLVGGSTSSDPQATDVVEVVFDILRYRQGSFIFENDAVCPAPSPPSPIIPALEQAEAALAEWLEILRVVPSLDSVVRLADSLPHPEVVVDQACWTSIVAVGGGATVEQLGDYLGLGELPVCRLVRALVSAGFVMVSDPEEGVGQPSTPAPPLAEVEVPELDERESSSLTLDDEPPAPESGDAFDSEPLTAWGSSDWDEAEPEELPEGTVPELELPELTISGLEDDPFAPESFPEPVDPETTRTSLYDSSAFIPEGEEQDDDEDLSQALSMLSPKAAQAVAAASSERPTDSPFDELDDLRPTD